MLCCIPTGERNKHVNRCTNLWSVFVLVGLLLGVAGSLLMYLSTEGITTSMFKKVNEQLEFLNRVGEGKVTPEEAELFIKKMPQELRNQVEATLEEMGVEDGLTPENIQKALEAGYTAEDLETLKEDGEFNERDWNDYENWENTDEIETYFDPAEMGAYEQCYEIEHRCMKEGDMCWSDAYDDAAWNACQEIDNVCWGEYDACWTAMDATYATDGHAACADCVEDTGLTTEDEAKRHHDKRRRRMFGVKGLPKRGAIQSFKQYQQYGLIGLLVLGLMGPIITTVGMIFFCCQLKKLADDKETACESCCGTLSGCLIFPVVFILAMVLSIFAALFMNVMCVFLAAPFELVGVMMKLRESAVDVARGQAAPASLMPVLGEILPMLKGAALTAINGDLCKTNTEHPSYLMTDVLDYDPKLCKGWLMSYRFGTASQIICAVASVFGVLICFYVGYKACCRNSRGKTSTDIEMA